jgi:hypothetical protein
MTLWLCLAASVQHLMGYMKNHVSSVDIGNAYQR